MATKHELKPCPDCGTPIYATSNKCKSCYYKTRPRGTFNNHTLQKLVPAEAFGIGLRRKVRL